jgi:hypothetical protein
MFKTHVIPAEAYSDDNQVKVNFDAEPWFNQAPDYEIEGLAECGWGGEEPADYVAYFFDATSTKRLFDYLSFGLTMPYTGETVGFECRIDENAALAWLEKHRPDLWKKIYRTGF